MPERFLGADAFGVRFRAVPTFLLGADAELPHARGASNCLGVCGLGFRVQGPRG